MPIPFEQAPAGMLAAFSAIPPAFNDFGEVPQEMARHVTEDAMWEGYAAATQHAFLSEYDRFHHQGSI